MQPLIRLNTKPKTGRRRAPISSAAQPICGACKVQISRYMCPHCNLHYCSLSCFRSPAHSNCSESFDRSELQDEIRLAQNKTAEEKRAMMDMLKELEQQSLQQEEEQVFDQDRERLENSLQGLDLDSLSPDDLLAMLSDSQRAAFEQTLHDPSKTEELLAETMDEGISWWQDEREDGTIEVLDDEIDRISEPTLPELIDSTCLPKLKLDSSGKVAVNANLIYNIVAVLFGYALTVRTFAVSALDELAENSVDRSSARSMLAQLLPFLVEKSTLVLQDFDSAIQFVMSRYLAESLHSELLSVLVQDIQILLRSNPVTEIDASDSIIYPHTPLRSTLAGLSDIYRLFESTVSAKSADKTTPALSKRQSGAAAQKLLFYFALLVHRKSPVTTSVLDRVRRQAQAAVHDRQADAEVKASARQPKSMIENLNPAATRLRILEQSAKPRIEEIE